MIPAIHELPRGLKGYVKALAPAGRIREDADRPQNEREWQARFYQGDLGIRWRSMDGALVELLDAGFWNQEAGPDFVGATLLVDGSERLRGDIELDLCALDWERHGHAANPAFSRVILHVFSRPSARTFFTRTCENRNVRQVALPAAAGTPAPLPDLGSVPRTAALRLLDQAVRFRFHEKSRRLRQMVRLHDWPGALDQCLATALGYKRNSAAFLLLAQRCRWNEPPSARAEARLFGLAGFLDAARFGRASPPARAYLRQLWDHWWTLRGAGGRLQLPPEIWSLGGIRPANHPHRRIGALAASRQRLREWSAAFRDRDLARLAGELGGLRHPFWQGHWNLRGTALPGAPSLALIGRERLEDFLLNYFYPWSLSESPAEWTAFKNLRAPAIPARVRDLAAWLCPELDRRDLGMAWIQQGLYQLNADIRGRKPPRELARELGF